MLDILNKVSQLSDSVQRAIFSKGLADNEELENEDVKALYEVRPSIAKHLPIREFQLNDNTFLHEDGVSTGAIFTIESVDTDGRSSQFLENVRATIVNALHTLPTRAVNPYVVQIYVKDEPYTDIRDNIENYVNDRAKGHPFSNQYIDHLTEHLEQVCERGGIFEEGGVGWRGKQRTIRCVIYRTYTKNDLNKGVDPNADINDVTEAVIGSLKSGGIITNRMTGEDYYHWLFPWFNPAPQVTDGDPYQYMAERPYPLEDEKSGELPISFDLSSYCFSKEPKAMSEDSGVFELAGGFAEYLGLAPLSAKPRTGVFGVEEISADQNNIHAALLDSLPEESTLCMTITAIDQYSVEKRGEAILMKTGGRSDSQNEATNQATRQVEQFRYLKDNQAKVFKLNMGLFLSAMSLSQLDKRRKMAVQALTKHKLPTLESGSDLIKQQSFLSQLPMAYRPQFDDIEARAGHAYTHHIASLLPFYGRSRGTGNLGFVNFNRSGELLSFDPFNKKDRRRAAHGIFLGPTGSGKSATSTYLIEHFMAMHNPQMIVVESGNSFGLLADHAQANGCKVKHVRLSANSDVALSPFADALLALSQFEKSEQDHSAYLENSVNIADDFIESDDISEERDILGEMELSARLMITGGEEKEENLMTRPDRLLIRRCILDAARNVREQRGSDGEVIVSDLIAALKNIVNTSEIIRHKERSQYMMDSLMLWTQGVEAKFFNRPGKGWSSDDDLTIIDLDLFARKGMEDKLAVVMTGLLNRINGMAEAAQHSGRPIIVWIDEAHIATTNPLLAPYIATIGKMWRKLNTWLWLCTQNMKDFPDVANKMLSMAEFWVCLSPPIDEIEQIARFKSLSEDEKLMLKNSRKVLPKYVEGVVLSPELTTLFRVIPPSRSLALGMTEGHEKEARGDIMKDKNCSELEAAYEIGRQIFDARSRYKESSPDRMLDIV